MRKARRGGDAVAVEALNAEHDDLSAEEVKSKLRAGHLNREDKFLKVWDASMKKLTDSVNNDINK